MSNTHDYRKAYNNMRRKQNALLVESTDLKERVIDFFAAYPNPTDKQVHEWAEEIGVDTKVVEEEIYKLATKFVRFWKGGKSNLVKDFSYNEEQLKMGIEVELEHTPDRDVAEKIAKDHLVEKGLEDSYYTLLKEMEESQET